VQSGNELENVCVGTNRMTPYGNGKGNASAFRKGARNRISGTDCVGPEKTNAKGSGGTNSSEKTTKTTPKRGGRTAYEASGRQRRERREEIQSRIGPPKQRDAKGGGLFSKGVTAGGSSHGGVPVQEGVNGGADGAWVGGGESGRLMGLVRRGGVTETGGLTAPSGEKTKGMLKSVSVDGGGESK